MRIGVDVRSKINGAYVEEERETHIDGIYSCACIQREAED
jgi:hypothetical protein